MKHITKMSLFGILLLVILSGCSKGGNANEPPPEEANLVVSFGPEVSGGINQTLTHEYKFNVVLSSSLPVQGIEIKIDFVKDSGGSVFSQTLTSTNASNAVTITGISFNEIGTVTVMITSKSKPTNTTTKTFKLIRK